MDISRIFEGLEYRICKAHNTGIIIRLHLRDNDAIADWIALKSSENFAYVLEETPFRIILKIYNVTVEFDQLYDKTVDGILFYSCGVTLENRLPKMSFVRFSNSNITLDTGRQYFRRVKIVGFYKIHDMHMFQLTCKLVHMSDCHGIVTRQFIDCKHVSIVNSRGVIDGRRFSRIPVVNLENSALRIRSIRSLSQHKNIRMLHPGHAPIMRSEQKIIWIPKVVSRSNQPY